MRIHNSSSLPIRALLAVAISVTLFGIVFSSPVNPRADPSSSSIGSTTVSATAVPSATSTLNTGSITALTTTTPTTSPSVDATTDATSSGTVESDSATTTSPSDSSSATPTIPPDPNTPRCSKDTVGHFPPFCEPKNNTEVYVDQTYYITWDVAEFSSPNITVTVLIDYVNVTGISGQNAFHSDPTPKNIGFITTTMNREWLHDNALVNLSLTMVQYDPFLKKEADRSAGPIITLTNAPAVHYPPPPPSNPNKLGIFIGIPVGLGFVALILCGLCIGMRKHRKIDIKGLAGRKKGYGVGKSRRQRMGKGGGIRLQEREVNPPRGSVFRDDPVEAEESERRFQAHTRDESLGSLVNSPARENFEQGRDGQNAFRQEIARQQTGR